MDTGTGATQSPQRPGMQAGPGPGQAPQGGTRDQLDALGTQAMRTAHDLMDEAKASGGAIAADVTQGVTSAVEGAKDEAAAGLEGIADALHRTGKDIGGEHAWVAELVDQGASGLAELAQSLRTNDLQGMLAKVQDMARAQPALFAGAAMALGFAAVRFGRIAATAPAATETPDVAT